MVDVAELIEHLQKYPKDTKVVCMYMCCSDPEPLELSNLTFFKDGKLRNGDRRRFVERNGRIVPYDEATWPKGEEPKFVPVLLFPGN